MSELQNQEKLGLRMVRSLSRLGARTITALAVALVAAVLLVLSPEIGIASAFGGVVLGGVSAVLLRTHVGA